MSKTIFKTAVVSAALVFGALQANAGECVLTVTRTACSKEAEAESFKKCGGKASCDENNKTGTAEACAKAAVKACVNAKDRQSVTKSKVITAMFDGKPVEGGKDLCDAKRDGFDLCAK